MAIKFHCSRCNAFIRDLEPSEAAKLQGDEICGQCRDLGRETLDTLVKEYNKLTQELGTVYNKSVLKLEETIARFFKK